MSDLPPGWEWAGIGELCSVNPRQFDIPPDDDETVSFVPMAAVEEETGHMDTSRRVRYGDVRGKSFTPFQELDVLFAKITPCMENGKVTVARGLESGRALGSTEFLVLRSLGVVLPRYLALYLLQLTVRHDAERNMTGAVGQRRVPRTYVEALLLPVPPLAEQQRIIAVLDLHLSRLRSAATSLRAASAKVDLLVTTARHNATTAFASDTQRLGDLLREVEAGKSFAAEGRPASPDEWGIIKISAMTWGEFRPNENKAVLGDHEIDIHHEIRSGDILISRANTEKYVGAAVLVRETRAKLLLSDKSLRLVPKQSVDPMWLIEVLASPAVRSQISARATGMKDSMRNISQQALREIRVPCATPEQQAQAVAALFGLRAETKRLRSEIDTAERRQRSLRESLLRDAFAGRLIPQNPDDEPASALVERVKAQRVAQPKPRQARRATDPGQEHRS